MARAPKSDGGWAGRILPRSAGQFVEGVGEMTANSQAPAIVNAIEGLGFVFVNDAIKARILRPLVRRLLRAALDGPLPARAGSPDSPVLTSGASCG